MFKVYSDDKWSSRDAGRPASSFRAGNVSVDSRKPQTRTASSGSGGGSPVERFNPAYDKMDEGSVVEDWIPRDMPGIHRMLRLIYQRDEVGGPMVDIYREMAWSDFDLLQIDDPEMMRPFEESIHSLDLLSALPDISSEVLVIGRSINSLIWDDGPGIFTGIIPHDPDFCRIIPQPIHGVDPLVDLRSSPGWKEFLDSDDERVQALRGTIPGRMLDNLSDTGFVPLEPVSTVFIRRRASAYDHVGTSIYTRLINFLAIQKALLDATVIGVRRRSGGTLHIIAGNERWEPSEEELSNLGGSFMQAEEDQGGGIVVTRDGVQTERGSSGSGDIWKLSDEWSFLSEGKMRALGVSDAFLAGDASFNNMEMALSVFLERLRGFREMMTNQLITRRIFHTIARAHGFIKPENNDPTSRRNAALMSYRQSLKLPANRLIVPEVRWHKSLHAVGDESQITLLDRMKEAGLPVTLEHYAAAGGFNLKRAMSMLDADIDNRKKLKKWQSSTAPAEGGEGGEGGDGGGSIFGKVGASPLQYVKPEYLRSAAPRAMTNLSLWDSRDTFCGLDKREATHAMDRVLPYVQRSKRPTIASVMAQSGLSGRKQESFRYLLARLGLAGTYTMKSRTFDDVTAHLRRLDKKTALLEMRILGQTCGGFAKTDDVRVDNPKPVDKAERITGLPTGPSGKQLLTGFIK